MNLRIITKNHAAVSVIQFITNSISKLYGRATAMPLAWDLSNQAPSIKYIKIIIQ